MLPSFLGGLALRRGSFPDEEEAEDEEDEEPDRGEAIALAAFFLELEFQLQWLFSADLDLAFEDDASSG